MKSPLRPAGHTLALAAAFVGGWVLHSTPTAEPPAHAAVLRRSLERGTMRGPAVEGGTARSDSDSVATAKTSRVENPLPALRSLALTGAAATPLERLQLLAQYGAHDPETALTFVETLPAAQRADAAATVMSAWAARDPGAAAAHLEAEAGGFGLSGKEAEAAASAVALEWARRDPKAAAAWAASLPDELRAAALHAAIGVQAAADPGAAQQFYASLTEAALRTEAAAPLAAQWAATDPAAAAVWAVSLADESGRAAAATGVSASWMLRDPAAASRWVDGLPAGAAKDAAIAALTESPALKNDPDSAAVWAAAIQNESLRRTALAAAVRRWRYQQPEAFAAAVQAAER